MLQNVHDDGESSIGEDSYLRIRQQMSLIYEFPRAAQVEDVSDARSLMLAETAIHLL